MARPGRQAHFLQAFRGPGFRISRPGQVQGHADVLQRAEVGQQPEALEHDPLLFPSDDSPALDQAGEVSPEGVAARPHTRHGSRVDVAGEVERYVVGPLGHVRGFLLTDGTTVMVHGTEGDAMAREVPAGQSVRVQGWSPAASGGKSVVHAAVFGQHGQVVTPPSRQDGRPDREARRQAWSEKRAEIEKLPDATASGTVRAVMIGRHGKPIAAVLTDGTNVFLRPALARAVRGRGIHAGDRIGASGKGATYPLGASLVVSSITFGDGAHFEARPGTGGEAR